MNAGYDYSEAIEWAKANAKLTGTPRYLHLYGYVYWISTTPPTCNHWIIHPDGTVSES